MSAVMPRMIPTFKMLLPTTFPIVIAAFDYKAAVIETKASGRLVPIATIVSPIISWGMPKRDAILLDPSTNQSAPFSSRINPNTNKIMFICFPPGPDKIKRLWSYVPKSCHFITVRI